MLRHGVPQGSIIYADHTNVTASADVKNLAHLDLSLNKSVREIPAWAIAINFYL